MLAPTTHRRIGQTEPLAGVGTLRGAARDLSHAQSVRSLASPMVLPIFETRDRFPPAETARAFDRIGDQMVARRALGRRDRILPKRSPGAGGERTKDPGQGQLLRCRWNISSTHWNPRRRLSGSRKPAREVGGSNWAGPSAGRTSG
jgi:hypothetical protein